MRRADEESVAELGRAAFSEYAREPGAGVLAMARRGRTVVAIEGDLLVGFAVVELSGPRQAHLAAISVAEDARGRGVAHALLRAAERIARSEGAPSLGLVTADSNLAALELFLQSGFQRVAKLPRYYQRGQNAVRLEKVL
jgi:ribosomal protein S18 acetylase RimI-like enzyme